MQSKMFLIKVDLKTRYMSLATVPNRICPKLLLNKRKCSKYPSPATAFIVKWLACSPRFWKVVGSIPNRIKPNTFKLVFAASMFRTQYFGVRAITNRYVKFLLLCKLMVFNFTIPSGQFYSSIESFVEIKLTPN